jgi:uncharacterized membrane protein
VLSAAKLRRHPSGRGPQRGQVLVMFALSMVLLIFGLIAVAIDLATLYEAHVRYYDAAEQAAIAGASDVLAICPENGSACTNSAELGLPPTIDPATFQSECSDVGDAVSGGTTTCSSPWVCAAPPGAYSGPSTCSTRSGAAGIELQEAVATVQGPVSLPIPMPGMGASITVSATYRAAPVLGAQQPAA